ncbi:MAG: histidine kinase, partial [Ferruginibacter sp.]
GYIAGIATKDNNTYYIGTAEGLLEWKRNTNETNFISYRDDKGNLLPKKAELYSIVIDKYDKIWATASENGIIVLDKNRKLVKHIKNGSEDKQHVKLSRVAYLLESPDGFIWACGANGLCRIDPQTFEVDNFKNSALNKFDSLLCSPILFTDKDNLWIATGQSGVFHYNFSTKKLDQYNTGNGLVHNGVFCINADASGNIYIGTRLGLNILFTDGRIKTLTQKDGLLIDRAEGLLLDKNNRMWIGNDIGLACYNPKDSSLVSFDERYGLSIYGFRVGSYFETPNGEFVFGTPRGLQSFHPDSLFNKKLKLNAHISKIETKTIASGITDNAVFRLLAYDNQATFYFGSVDFSQHIRTYYQYQLSGIDKDWIKVVDQNVVRYNSLPPGKYTFRLRISNNNKTWQDAGNEVTIIIAAPFYETWWFKLLGVLLAISIIFIVINYYRKKQLDKRSELETELVITYFASQINSHKKTDDLLWDIAKNCISKLHFEDCVIYLKDEKNMLVQKAAYGPKNPVDFTIHKPIEIPVGSGIVGTVAQTGKAELVGNTEEDSRYITDDEKRSSEIAVPIIIDEEVIGVIDSENKRKNFFTQKHLQVLSTIAALCANQVQKTNAEEEKQRATIELLKNKQKAVESRLQSLRLQMNPHFLFNALNSIQQMILANEDIVATKYLSKFSRLLRSILVQSDKESISLKEELEILNLYIELESIRFKESFQYKIICDDMIDTDEIRIPALLVQPFVENAIWHGLMHKEGERILKVEFTEENDFVKCTIEDNGIGRKKAAEMKTSSGQDKKHVSKGIEVSQERLKAMCTKDGREGNIKIIDLADDHGDDCGTRVEINFPIIN